MNGRTVSGQPNHFDLDYATSDGWPAVVGANGGSWETRERARALDCHMTKIRLIHFKSHEKWTAVRESRRAASSADVWKDTAPNGACTPLLAQGTLV